MNFINYTSFRILLLLPLLALLVGCGGERECHVTTGIVGCDIDPVYDAYYADLYPIGGYIYLKNQGHRGVVVIHSGIGEYVAYERACPCDDSSRVAISQEWGSTVLECPRCHSCFDPMSSGMPFDGSATPCPLFQYSAYFDGSMLHIN